MKISFIIPVYNVENYLQKCVESVLKQNCDKEIILVDDGSTDGSGKICDDYAEKYPESITVLHKGNGGLSSARNAGLEKASGDLTMFVDSDDYIDDSAAEVIIGVFSDCDCDCVMFNGVRETGSEKTPVSRSESFGPVKGSAFMARKIREKALWAPVTFYCYKRSLLADNDFYFKQGILSEDEQFTPRVLLKCEKICYTDYPIYYYVSREGSITCTKNPEKIKKRYFDMINTIFELEKLYDSASMEKKEKLILKDYLARQYLNCASEIKKLQKFKADKNFLKKNARLFSTKLKKYLFLFNYRLYNRLK